MVLGLSGRYCAGKNEAADVFSERGFQVIDVDRLGHRALQVSRREVADSFGEGVLGPDGEVDRKKLGALVFRDHKKRAQLEKIVHPLMVEEVKNTISQAEAPILINAALLFTMGLDRLCGKIIIVRAPLLQRICRGLARDGLGLTGTMQRIWSQRSLIPQSSLRSADILIVENSGTREKFRAEISSVISRLTA